MACKKKLAEEKKEVVTDEALENVTGGALAGLSASPVTTEISFTEPTSPYANTADTETLATGTVSASGALAISSTIQVPATPTNPILKGTPIKNK